MNRDNLSLLVILGMCIVAAGRGHASNQSSEIQTTEMTLQSGETLRGFTLHFINHDSDWKLTADPIRTRVSDSETKDIARESLRGVRVTQIERDEKGHVERLQVVYATDEGEIRG